MKGRMIRPEFFSDSVMAALPIETRMTFIGLWCLADDAGYFRWQPPEIAATIYVYETPTIREPMVLRDLDLLLEHDRVRLLSCNRHGLVPSLPKYRFKSGRQTLFVRDEHSNCNLWKHSEVRGMPSGLPEGMPDGRLATTQVTTQVTTQSEGLSPSEDDWKKVGDILRKYAKNDE